jgi:hypothetical protein
MVWDCCGPHQVSGLNGERYWFLAVCPLGYNWGATAVQKSEFLVIVD